MNSCPLSKTPNNQHVCWLDQSKARMLQSLPLLFSWLILPAPSLSVPTLSSISSTLADSPKPFSFLYSRFLSLLQIQRHFSSLSTEKLNGVSSLYSSFRFLFFRRQNHRYLASFYSPSALQALLSLLSQAKSTTLLQGNKITLNLLSFSFYYYFLIIILAA